MVNATGGGGKRDENNKRGEGSEEVEECKDGGGEGGDGENTARPPASLHRIQAAMRMVQARLRESNALGVRPRKGVQASCLDLTFSWLPNSLEKYSEQNPTSIDGSE